jgi:hypothetical protein
LHISIFLLIFAHRFENPLKITIITRKEIEQAKNELPLKKTKQQEEIYQSLRCREMVNSIMIYDGINALKNENNTFNKYLLSYVDELGEEKVNQLIKEQIDDFSKAVVKYNTYTDHEGCTYNTCIWADEQ